MKIVPKINLNLFDTVNKYLRMPDHPQSKTYRHYRVEKFYGQ